MSTRTILVVDDQENFRNSIAENLELTERYIALKAPGAATALAMVREHPEIACIILDYDLRKGGGPAMDGLEVMTKLDEIAPHIPVIMMSGITQGRGGVAAESIRNHAVAFLDKPFKTEKLLEILERTIGRAGEETVGADVHKRLAEVGFITVSPAMTKVCRDAIRAAEKGEGHVLLVGETGTGKDVLAHAIHKLSARAGEPFLAENCPTIDKGMFNSTLFGAVRGAYTDATDRPGVFEAAGKGIVFLDELTEMPIEVQAGLLRALESREYHRQGETNVRHLEARVIAATNRPLADAIRDGRLREDLRHRFERTITIPPLRERRKDIPIIVVHWLLERSKGGEPWTIEPEALATLARQPWEGNVRQLANIVNRAAANTDDYRITQELIAEELREEYGIGGSGTRGADLEMDGDLESTLERIRLRHVIRALIGSRGNVAGAAKALGYKSREGLKYWMDKYRIDADDFSGSPHTPEYYLEKYRSRE